MYFFLLRTWCGDGTRADVSSIFIMFRLVIDWLTPSVRYISRSVFGTFIVSGPKWGEGVWERKSLEPDLTAELNRKKKIKIKRSQIKKKNREKATFFEIHNRRREESRLVHGTWNSTSMLRMNHNWPHKIGAEYWP